jgi:Family of unknown function (DUF5991)
MPRLLVAALCLLLTPASGAATVQKAGRKRVARLPRLVVIDPAQGRDAWEGTYEFSEGGGRSAGAAMIVTHTLVIRKHDDVPDCDLDADGYQTSVSLRCDARKENGKLNIYFNSYREGNTFARYRKGQLLLTLERTTVGGKPRLVTHWGAYQPTFDPTRDGRVCFKKTK